jgi:pyridoxamine 5'-phosphate oxidase
MLEQRMSELWEKYPDGNVPRPAHWGGYVLAPARLEFWQGRPSRLHDRVEYVRNGQDWAIRRIAP